MAQTFRSIQVLRGVAATAVVVHHADRTGALNGLATTGAAGVDLFFVISGFIMATIATDRRPDRFLADRCWRILPLWFVALTPWLIVAENDWAEILTSLTLWPVWNEAFSMPALGVGWSLCFEMLFYLAFALALATRAIVPLIAFSGALLLTPLTESAVIDYLGSPLVFEFLAGVLIARLPLRESLAFPLLLIAIPWLIMAPAETSGLVVGGFGYSRVAAWGIPAAMIVYSALSLEKRFGPMFQVPVLVGNASYAIFLFHPLAVGFLDSFLLATAVSIGAGVLVHLTIERPMMRLRRMSLQQSATA